MPPYDQDTHEPMTVKTPMMHRNIVLARASSPGGSSDPYSFYFSNEDPVEGRWIDLGDGEYGYGTEILLHGAANVDMSWISSGNAPFLRDHEMDDQAGVIRGCMLDESKRALMVTDLLFSRNPCGQEVKNDIDDGIRNNVSVGYIIQEVIEVQPCDWRRGIPGVYHVTRWKPLECSSVSIPAVESVGFGRSANIPPSGERLLAAETVFYRHKQNNTNPTGERNMPPESNTETRGGAASESRVAETVVIQQPESDASRIHAIADLNRSVFPNGVEMGARAIAAGSTVTDFWREYQPALLKHQEEQATIQIGMTDKDKRRFSLVKLIRHLSDDKSVDASYELDVCRAYGEARGISSQRGGAIVPHEAIPMSKRAAIISSGTGAGVVEEIHSGEVIEYLREQAVLATAGARFINGLVGKFDMAKIGVGTTAYWVGENNESASDISTSSMDLDLLQFTLKTVGVNQGITRQMMKQTSLDVEAIVRGDIFAALADAIDLAGLAGSGSSNQPTGIVNTTNVGTETLATANAPAWSDVVNMETTVAEAKALRGQLAYIAHPTLIGNMKQTLKSSGVSGYVAENGQVNGYKLLSSNNAIYNSVKRIIFGNFAELMVGLWGGIEVVADPYTYSRKGIVSITAFQDVDIQLRHPAGFVVSANPAT